MSTESRDTVQSLVSDADVLDVEGAVEVVGGDHAWAARRSLAGKGRPLSRLWPFPGPAFIAAVAYLDPGNFATNISAGAQFGYLTPSTRPTDRPFDPCVARSPARLRATDEPTATRRHA